MIIYHNFYLFLMYFQTHLAKSQISLTETSVNLFSKSLFLAILIKIGVMFSNSTNKMGIFINSFLGNMNSILDEHATLKRINKYKSKFKSKPWTTPAIQKSIPVKNNLLKKLFIEKICKQKIFFMSNIKIIEICYLPFLKKAKQIIIINILKLI